MMTPTTTTTTVGTCLRMCPEREESMRVKRGLVHRLERRPDGSLRLIKEFSRSAAGVNACRPSDLRPPRICQETARYIVKEFLAGGAPLDVGVYDFVFDRLRSVRQDLSVQGWRDSAAHVEVMEVCARFHLLAGYRLRNRLDPRMNFSHLLEVVKSALVLLDKPSTDLATAYLLLNMGSPESISWGLDSPLRSHPDVDLAMKVNLCYLQRNFVGVLRLSNSLSSFGLLAFHWKLPHLLSEALAVMSVAYSSRNCKYPVALFSRLHCVDDGVTLELCHRHGLRLDDDGASIRFSRSSFVLSSKVAWPTFGPLEAALANLDMEEFFLPP